MLSQFGGRADFIQHHIEHGHAFEAALIPSVAVGTPSVGLFRTGAKSAIIIDRTVTPNGNEITYQAFRGPTVTSQGTEYTGITNRNCIKNIAPTVKIYTGATVSADGTPFPPVYMPGSEGVGNKAIGQFSKEGAIRILKPFTYYLTKVTNAGLTDPAKVELYLMWIEMDMPIGYGG